MSTARKDLVKVELARLYEKTSANGRRYFVGRMGSARVLMFLDERAESADPVWNLFAQELGDDQKPKAAAPQQSGKNGGGQRRSNNDGERRRAQAVSDRSQRPIDVHPGADPLNDDLPPGWQ